MKLKTAITYRMNYQLRSLVIYLGFFILFGMGFPLIAMLLSNTNETIASEVAGSGFIYMIILGAIGAHIDFKWFMQNGVSRFHIFLASCLTNLAISALLSLILLIAQLIVNHPLIQGFELSNVLAQVYGLHYFATFLFTTLLLFLAASLGTLIGLINASLPKVTQLIIALFLLMIPIISQVLIQILGSRFRTELFAFLKQIIGYSSHGMKVFPLVATFLVISALFVGIAYLLNRRRELSRAN